MSDLVMPDSEAAEWRSLIASLWDLDPADVEEVVALIDERQQREARHV